MKILIVEDELEIALLIEQTLVRDGFSCEKAMDGLEALTTFEQQRPDLIILDLMLPRLDGLEVCTRIRQQSNVQDPYILMLTAKGEEIDRVIGLSTGADDYLVKPFSPRELTARVRALLRRSLRHGGQTEDKSEVLHTKNFTLDLGRHIASFQNDRPLDLTTLEFNLLATMMGYPGRVWTRSQLIEKLWGNDFFGDERVVDTHIRRLRKKVEPDPTNPIFIKTVVGVGYKFEDQK